MQAIFRMSLVCIFAGEFWPVPFLVKSGHYVGIAASTAMTSAVQHRCVGARERESAREHAARRGAACKLWHWYQKGVAGVTRIIGPSASGDRDEWKWRGRDVVREIDRPTVRHHDVDGLCSSRQADCGVRAHVRSIIGISQNRDRSLSRPRSDHPQLWFKARGAGRLAG